MRVRALILASLLASGCESTPPPRGQWLVTVSTDARVPALGDGVTVWLLDADGAVACSACVRTFGAADLPLSFGVEATPRIASVRALLHRSQAAASDGSPRGPFVDVRLALPVPNGVTRIAVPLALGCFRDEDAAGFCDPASGAAVPDPPTATDAPPLVSGSAPLLADTPCAFPVRDGAVCVPGGAFLLGTREPVGDTSMPAFPERLVRVSPFALDRTEMTWAELDGLVASGVKVAEGCPHDGTPNHPARCLDREDARRLCKAKGGRLPTEAEWEFAAGNRGLETRAPWGDDVSDVCAHAVVSRGSEKTNSYCRATPSGGLLPEGTLAVGTYGDTTALGIADLAGNVSEWVDDASCLYEGSYWSSLPPLSLDPACHEGSGGVVRGGNYDASPSLARSASRLSAQGFSAYPQVGVRCAYDE